jgi:hypothetical protein
MSNQPGRPKARQPSPDSSAAVDVFMTTLQHPFKAEVAALRRIILDADPRITEGIKWNAPSFRTSEYFATTNLRAKIGIGLILHFGAKVRQLPAGVSAIDDPERLLQWLAPDRAMVEFADLGAILARQAALTALIRSWTALMDARPDAA